jgi:hypothetical protein
MSRIFDYSANKSVIRPVKNRKPPHEGRSEPRCQYGVGREKFMPSARNTTGSVEALMKRVVGPPPTPYTMGQTGYGNRLSLARAAV